MMSSKPLYVSSKHRNLLNAIKKFNDEKGYGPSFEEVLTLQTGMNFGTINNKLDDLIEAGMIENIDNQFFVVVERDERRTEDGPVE